MEGYTCRGIKAELSVDVCSPAPTRPSVVKAEVLWHIDTWSTGWRVSSDSWLLSDLLQVTHLLCKIKRMLPRTLQLSLSRDLWNPPFPTCPYHTHTHPLFPTSGPTPFIKPSPGSPAHAHHFRTVQAGWNFECHVSRAPFVIWTFDWGFVFSQHVFCLHCLSFVQHLSHEYCGSTKLVSVIADVLKLTKQMVAMVLD